MESRVVQIYTMYNSIVSDGRRVRRMRRTELSAQKVINNISTKRGQRTRRKSGQKQTPSQSHSRSHPKIQPKWTKQTASRSKANHLANVQNQYFSRIADVSEFRRQKSRNSSRNLSTSRKKDNQLSLSRKKLDRSNAENSYYNTNGINDSAKREDNQVIRSGQSINQKTYQVGSKKQQIANIKRPSNRRSENSYSNEKNSNQNIQANQPKGQKSRLNQYGLKVETAKLKLSQLGIKNISNNNSNQSSIVSVNKQPIIKQRISNQPSSTSNKNHPENKSNISKKQKQQQQINSQNKKNGSSFLKRQSSQLDQMQQVMSKHVESNKFAGTENQIFSKLRINHQQNHIINGSNPKRQSWDQAIKSLTQVDKFSHNEQQNYSKQYQHMQDSKKISLKMDSLRDDNFNQSDKLQSSYKNSLRQYLPLASKEPSQRKSFQSLSSRPSEPGTLKFVLENIQLHDYLVSLLNQFKQQTEAFNKDQNDEILIFLLEKKYFYQKSSMIKALKGGKNIFKLSTVEIENEDLKKYLKTEQILKITKQLQSQNRQLFNNLKKRYLQLKQSSSNKNNPFLKLQSPSDDFSKQIVRRLQLQHDQLCKKLKSTQDDEQLQSLQNRIFSIVEIVFLLSEMNGRNVKKIQFYDEIADFQLYYNQNQRVLKETLAYFKNLK